MTDQQHAALLRTFRAVRPSFESSITWDDDDRNVDAINERAESMVELADCEEHGHVDYADFIDAAVEYVTKP